ITHALLVKFLLHFELLVLIPRVHDQLSGLKPLEYRPDVAPAEGAGAAGDQNGFVVEHAVCGPITRFWLQAPGAGNSRSSATIARTDPARPRGHVSAPQSC